MKLRIALTASVALAAVSIASAPQVVSAQGGHVCVSINGVVKQQRGTALCYTPSTPAGEFPFGGGRTKAVAIGDGAVAFVDDYGGGTSASATAIGKNARADVSRWGGTVDARAIGDGASAVVGNSSDSSVKAIGHNSEVVLVFSENTTAAAFGGCTMIREHEVDQRLSCRG